MSALSAPYMHDEAAAFTHVEAMLWADGPVCPHCGVVGSAYELKGVYQHCNKRHLHRYAAEFEFRYNNRTKNGVDDSNRAEIALLSVVGKRMLYRDSLA